MKRVNYSKGGISLILDKITDLLPKQMKGINKIIINTSSQPNSNPHLGTITTMMCCFCLAKEIKKYTNIETIVEFDELENSPKEELVIDGKVYTKSLGEIYNGDITFAESYMNKYIELFEFLKNKTGIKYNIKSYFDFQKNSTIRKTIIDIYNDIDYFSELLDPSNHGMLVRTKCPICNWSNRSPSSYKYLATDENLTIKSDCFEHGEYELNITADNNCYIDMNTQLRDLTKGVLFSLRLDENGVLTIMCDGKDWSGEWAQRIHYKGMRRLGIKNVTERLFTPLITDWSGGKFSKSVYLQKGSYTGKEKIMADYDSIIQKYGIAGLEKIYNEVCSWVLSPEKFFRNYSEEYFVYLLEEIEDE